MSRAAQEASKCCLQRRQFCFIKMFLGKTTGNRPVSYTHLDVYKRQRLNLLTDRVDIVRDLGWRRNTSALTDTDVKYLLLYFEQNYGLTSEKKMTAALSIVANENCYHPIQDVLNGLVWDGTPRIRSCLHHFLGAEVSDYVEEMLKHFLLGAIRRVFFPGSKYEEMLCLVGGQGAGKSSFFRLLAIRDEWFSDDLKKLDDDRVYLKLQGHWIIEMSEMLATSSAKSIEEIRSFISRQKETYRTPYEAQPKDRLRQCVFGGSSNTLDFLPLDRAGNRRFLPIMIYPENAEVHILEDEDASRAYLLQVWAEAMTVYRSGHYSCLLYTSAPSRKRRWKNWASLSPTRRSPKAGTTTASRPLMRSAGRSCLTSPDGMGCFCSCAASCSFCFIKMFLGKTTGNRLFQHIIQPLNGSAPVSYTHLEEPPNTHCRSRSLGWAS